MRGHSSGGGRPHRPGRSRARSSRPRCSCRSCLSGRNPRRTAPFPVGDVDEPRQLRLREWRVLLELPLSASAVVPARHWCCWLLVFWLLPLPPEAVPVVCAGTAAGHNAIAVMQMGILSMLSPGGVQPGGFDHPAAVHAHYLLAASISTRCREAAGQNGSVAPQPNRVSASGACARAPTSCL